jgi:hypothetical protein
MKGLLITSVLLGGCFYVDAINQRPSLAIVNTNSEVIERGQEGVTLQAEVDDPEGQIVKLTWKLYVCDDATAFETCDPEPLTESSSSTFTFTAPIARATGTAAESLLVELTGVDDFGAAARPGQQLIIPLGNAKPSVVVRHAASYGATINTPVDVFAVFGDADDTADNVSLEFVLFKPGVSAVAPIDLCDTITCPDPGQPGKKQIGKQFTPDLIGEWRIRVIARDPIAPPNSVDGDPGTTVFEDIVIVVVDQLPCLGVVSPAPPFESSLLPISEPTLFQVHQVIDAIDPYPSNIDDPILGQSDFHWSIKVNSGARQTLATQTGNSVDFDPDAFSSGDVVELRVEISDRGSPFPLTCDPADQTCQLDPTLVPVCLQRQTWKVVVQ